MPGSPGHPARSRRMRSSKKCGAYRQEALTHFPLKLIETTGAEALAKWRELKSVDQGTPVVYHAAAMRMWRDHYGAELIGMSSDTLNLRVPPSPKRGRRHWRSLAISTFTVPI